MHGEFNKGRAEELFKSAPTGNNIDVRVVIVWLVRAVTFLLARYIDGA